MTERFIMFSHKLSTTRSPLIKSALFFSSIFQSQHNTTQYNIKTK
ncbi:MAG: hypothetical protein Terrestrivirus1_285 [Terrestrivirus sp.]|uniref:Uncharacterized protein n=1 Tax=Terrestrivirus sp. TaxID=2487775 RepID=A0A3G4ZMY8_9VIRU|nr:MAG: hypothetical protein Terrestrivirus1_285 [Terrestrivirus sp.]